MRNDRSRSLEALSRISGEQKVKCTTAQKRKHSSHRGMESEKKTRVSSRSSHIKPKLWMYWQRRSPPPLNMRQLISLRIGRVESRSAYLLLFWTVMVNTTTHAVVADSLSMCLKPTTLAAQHNWQDCGNPKHKSAHNKPSRSHFPSTKDEPKIAVNSNNRWRANCFN